MDSGPARVKCSEGGSADDLDGSSRCQPGLSAWGKFFFGEAGGFREGGQHRPCLERLLDLDEPGSGSDAAGAENAADSAGPASTDRRVTERGHRWLRWRAFVAFPRFRKGMLPPLEQAGNTLLDLAHVGAFG